MHIHCLGINHRTAEIGLREQVAYSPESARAALARFGCGGACPPLQAPPAYLAEMVILSTCTRVEIYAVSNQSSPQPLVDFLAETRRLDVERFLSHTYHFLDRHAVEHLFRVAAGLDSLVLGEPQILGQVMQAFEQARAQSSAGPLLSRLFQAALHAGKRARSETAIGNNPASIASVAVHKAERAAPRLAQAHVVVLGAGEMAELVVEALRKRGVRQITVANRTLARARALSDRWQAQAATFEQLEDLISQADILVASTGAPHTIILPGPVQNALRLRPQRSLVIIDIALPRDVDPAVASLPGVCLYDLDTLQEGLESSLALRQAEVPQVEEILAAELEAFMDYLASLDVFPVIAALRQQAEDIRLAELEKTLRRMPGLSPAERQRLEALTQALVKKLLHKPIHTLRDQAGQPSSAEYTAAARQLFGIDT